MSKIEEMMSTYLESMEAKLEKLKILEDLQAKMEKLEELKMMSGKRKQILRINRLMKYVTKGCKFDLKQSWYKGGDSEELLEEVIENSIIYHFCQTHVLRVNQAGNTLGEEVFEMVMEVRHKSLESCGETMESNEL